MKYILLFVRILLINLYLNNYCYGTVHSHLNTFKSDNIHSEITEVGCVAEWAPPQIILMHTPGFEQFLGIIHPKSALFEKSFDLVNAISQHKNFISLLEKNGAKVVNIQDILLRGTRDKNGNIVHGKDLRLLRAFAEKFLTIKPIYFSSTDIANEREQEYKMQILKSLSPEALISIIFLRPTVLVEPSKTNTHFAARYELSPLMNLMFLRDQLITTKKGIVLGNMNSKQRKYEIKVIEFALKKLGIQILAKIKDPCYLEGGDFLTTPRIAFIGQGLRTNSSAIKQLLKDKLFGTEYVVVVKDPWKNQQEMHLDTYFNIISEKLAVLSEWRISGVNEKKRKMPTFVDVYQLKRNKYHLVQKNIKFIDYLEKQLGFKIIPVSRENQIKYGINFLTISPNTILAIDGVTQDYKNKLKLEGVTATWMNFSEITSGFGAAHCITQPILRKYYGINQKYAKSHTQIK